MIIIRIDIIIKIVIIDFSIIIIRIIKIIIIKNPLWHGKFLYFTY